MPLPADIVAAISHRLAEHAGLDLPDWVVEARAAARIAATGLAPAEYVELIAVGRGAAELSELVEAVRVGETRLFRHRSQIAAVIDGVAPVLRARGKRAVRVWSAGCAAGEEPVTLACVLARALPGVQISILATDVSSEALAVAEEGWYPASALDDVPDAWRTDFERDGDRIRVRRDLAALVRYERANLVDGTTPRGCDLVWCRNVLIYFTPAARRRTIDRLIAATSPGGFLFVGYSENLRDVDGLEALRAGDAVYYMRRDEDTGPRNAVPREIAVSRASTPVIGVSVARTSTAERGVLVVHGVNRTPPSGIPIARPASRDRADDDSGAVERAASPVITRATKGDTLALRGHPTAREVTIELTARLAIIGLETLRVDLDGADLLDDDLAPVLRRARAAAQAAGVSLHISATRAGARRWLARHALDGDA
ncbi:MAG: hypothetical protein KIT31_28415 [Deltaproteobacteria bacterium]|nr:hypothetical protein [Deltaproteobacteria bacterium]